MTVILHILPYYTPKTGGTIIRVRGLLDPIVQSGKHESHILVSRNDAQGNSLYQHQVADYELINGLHVHRVDNYFDIVKYGRKLKKKHGVKIVHSHNLGFSSLGALISYPAAKHIVELHTIREIPKWRYWLERIVLHNSDAIVVLSNRASSWLRSTFGLKEDKISLIWNGYSPERFACVRNRESIFEELGLIWKEDPIVGYVGSFYTFQGVMNFVQMAKKLNSVSPWIRYLMVGDGPEKDRVVNYISSHGLEKKFTILPWVLPEQIPSYLSILDIFVIPRPKNLATDTAVPLKVLEAMVLEVPIVATMTGGLQEILRNNENAILVEPTIDALAEGTKFLLDRPKLSAEIGKRAFTEARPLTWENQSKKLEVLYDYLLI